MSQSVIPQPVPPPTVEGLVSQANIAAAWEKVRKNGGAAGVDGVTITALDQRFGQEWGRVREDILAGVWQPHPVRAVDIPKGDGGTRTLGIPTVMDRVVQQALAQVIAPLWESDFSASSFAYRPGRGAHQAVLAAQRAIATGREWVVDLDIEKFFDHVHHARLLERLASRIGDVSVVTLVQRCLEAGSVRGGFRLPATEGTPQGSPLAPLLSNIVLDELDHHLDAQKQPFARYADDIVIFCSSEDEAKAQRMAVSTFLQDRLDLHLNEAKTGLRSPDHVGFLGFTFAKDNTGAWRRAISPASLEAFRAHVDELVESALSHSQPFESAAQGIGTYVQSWERYYRLAESTNTAKKLRGYARTALRRLLWTMWATQDRRIGELVQRGIALESARQFVQTCADATAAATSSVMGNALPNAALATYGLDEPSAQAATPYAVASTHVKAGLTHSKTTAKAQTRHFPPIPSAVPAAPPLMSEGAPSLAVGQDIGAHLGFCFSLGAFGSLKGTIDLRWPRRLTSITPHPSSAR